MRKIFGYIERIEFPYIVGMFFLATMVYGLVVNTLLQKFGIKDPLSFRFIWPIYILVIPLIYKAYSQVRKIRSINLYSLLILILGIINPVVAIVGSFYLNVSNDNGLTILSLLLIIVVFILTFCRKNVESASHLISIYSAAISLIFSNSLRSNFLVGWDIHQEYLVFRLTSTHNMWDMSFFRDAYNACLSITILPTIIHNLTRIETLTIFRFIYPFFLALIPLVVYWIGTRLTKINFAYAAAFAFLLQSQFFNQLPGLLRQGIGFLFFGLLIDLMIRKDLKLGNKKILFVLFSLGMILSHYSTTYMAVGIFFLTKGTLISLKFILKNKKKTVLSFPVLFSLLAMTFFWNTLITRTTKGLSDTISQIGRNVDKSFTLENKSSMVKDVFFQGTDNASMVNNFSRSSLETLGHPEDYEAYRLQPVVIDHLRPVSIRSPIPAYFHILIPWIFRISILIGFFYIALKTYKNKEATDSIGLSIAMLCIIAASIVIPYVSVNYNLERILQQMLVLLSPFCIISFCLLFKKIKFIPIVLPVSVLLISYLIQTTGFVDMYIYGTKSIMFNNDGEQYYQYYTKLGEVQSLFWLDKHTDESSVINIDRYTALRLKAYSTMKYKYINLDLNPPDMGEGHYIVLGNAATKVNAVFSQFRNQIIRYAVPQKFLEDKKDVIYSNSVSEIYR